MKYVHIEVFLMLFNDFKPFVEDADKYF